MPSSTSSDATKAKDLALLAMKLLTQGGNLESTTGGVSINRTQLTDAIEHRIQSNISSNLASASLIARSAAIDAVKNAESAMNKIAGGSSAATLSDLEIGSLEAIVEVTGRPATRYEKGSVQMPLTNLGDNDKWRTLIVTGRSRINKASDSVGRISITAPSGRIEIIGTGWRGAGNLIVTNRHVAADLVNDREASPATWTIDPAKQATIDFQATDKPKSVVRFEIAELAYCAQEVDIDVALLRVTQDANGLPAALKLDWNLASLGRNLPAPPGGSSQFQGEDIYVVGHPYRQLGSELSVSIFGQADGTKRWSPGRVVRVDPAKPSLDHDCSTLGGNSGSCILNAWNHTVVGIHFGGMDVDMATGKGSANVALAISRLGAHRLAEILKTGRTA